MTFDNGHAPGSLEKQGRKMNAQISKTVTQVAAQRGPWRVPESDRAKGDGTAAGKWKQIGNLQIQIPQTSGLKRGGERRRPRHLPSFWHEVLSDWERPQRTFRDVDNRLVLDS